MSEFPRSLRGIRPTLRTCPMCWERDKTKHNIHEYPLSPFTRVRGGDGSEDVVTAMSLCLRQGFFIMRTDSGWYYDAYRGEAVFLGEVADLDDDDDLAPVKQ